MFVSFLSTILIIVIYNKNATLKLFKVPNQNPTVFVTNAYCAKYASKNSGAVCNNTPNTCEKLMGTTGKMQENRGFLPYFLYHFAVRRFWFMQEIFLCPSKLCNILLRVNGRIAVAGKRDDAHDEKVWQIRHAKHFCADEHRCQHGIGRAAKHCRISQRSGQLHRQADYPRQQHAQRRTDGKQRRHLAALIARRQRANGQRQFEQPVIAVHGFSGKAGGN